MSSHLPLRWFPAARTIIHLGMHVHKDSITAAVLAGLIQRCTVTSPPRTELSDVPKLRHRMPLRRRSWSLAVAAAALVSCSAPTDVMFKDQVELPLGSWGAKGAGLIVSDTAVHLHVGCTYGDVSGRIPLDADGRFDVSGTYMLHAYPVTIGPTVPARFVGQLHGSVVSMTVTVNDTVAHETVQKGPVDVTFGAEIQLDPCPICRRPIITRSFWARATAYFARSE
ncbi:MAG: hypothetical protein ABJE47_10755 [bacterium]